MNFKNFEIYFPLKQKEELITKLSPKYFSGNFIDLGCGRKPYKEIISQHISKYIGVDIKNDIYQEIIKPEVFWDGAKLPLEDKTFDSGMLIEVLEHVPYPEDVLKELHRVLKKDATILITVPFLWTLHDLPNDEYRYTPIAVNRMLCKTGFTVLELESFGSWHASFANLLALYIKRGPISIKKKKTLYFLMKPLVKRLNKLDTKFDQKAFHNGQMITGIWCVAKKI